MRRSYFNNGSAAPSRGRKSGRVQLVAAGGRGIGPGPYAPRDLGPGIARQVPHPERRAHRDEAHTEERPVEVRHRRRRLVRDRTHDLVVRIERETNLTAVSHLTCVCHSLPEMTSILDRYAASGIENILALGGEQPRVV